MLFPVFLHVYDVAKEKKRNKLVVAINDMTQVLGFGGVFHGGICVDNVEWSYGFSETGSGVYSVEPQKNPMYRFRESVSLGVTPLSRQQVREVLLRLRREWVGSQYDLLAHNCCHFCEVFSRELSCKPTPGWLNRFAQSAEVARSLGSRSVGLLRTSLAKMLPISHPKHERTPACTSAPPSGAHLLSHSVSALPSAGQDNSSNVLIFQSLSSGFGAARHDSAGTAEAEDAEGGMFTRAALCTPIGEASPLKDEPAAMFSRPGLRHAHTDLRLGSAAPEADSPAAQPDGTLENLFGRPWSMMLEEEDYLRGLTDTVAEDCAQPPTSRRSDSGRPDSGRLGPDCPPCVPFRRESDRTLSGRPKLQVASRLPTQSPARRCPSGVLPSSRMLSGEASAQQQQQQQPWPGVAASGAFQRKSASHEGSLRQEPLGLPSQGSVCIAPGCTDGDGGHSCIHMLLQDGALFSQSADQGPAAASLAAAGEACASDADGSRLSSDRPSPPRSKAAGRFIQGVSWF